MEMKKLDRSSRLKELRRNFWLKELSDIVRGASGGFLLGTPLLYTMEVWWIGSSVQPAIMLSAIALTFIVALLLNRTEGFRSISTSTWLEAVTESIEALAIGIVCATVILILLRQIDLQTPLNEALGKLIFESVPFALGVAVANSALSGDRSTSNGANGQKPKAPTSKSLPQRTSARQVELNATLTDVGATLIGAIFIAFSIAPTEEVPMLAADISPPWLVLIIAASLLISYGIVFASGFLNQVKRQQQQGIFQRPLSETVSAYLVSVFAAALMLWFFQQLTFQDPWFVWLSHTLILGLPATIGGAAGRIVV